MAKLTLNQINKIEAMAKEIVKQPTTGLLHDLNLIQEQCMSSPIMMLISKVIEHIHKRR
jgi:hypothetical protein